MVFKVYIGNLPGGTSEAEIEREFSKFGTLSTVWVARKPAGFAFVEFMDNRDADDAVRELDGFQHWRVEHSRSGAPKPRQNFGGNYGDRDRDRGYGPRGGGGGYGRDRSPPPRRRRSPSYERPRRRSPSPRRSRRSPSPPPRRRSPSPRRSLSPAAADRSLSPRRGRSPGSRSP